MHSKVKSSRYAYCNKGPAEKPYYQMIRINNIINQNLYVATSSYYTVQYISDTISRFSRVLDRSYHGGQLSNYSFYKTTKIAHICYCFYTPWNECGKKNRLLYVEHGLSKWDVLQMKEKTAFHLAVYDGARTKNEFCIIISRTLRSKQSN